MGITANDTLQRKDRKIERNTERNFGRKKKIKAEWK
jgi:hypothetical protein